jgi:hypothetical protein
MSLVAYTCELCDKDFLSDRTDEQAEAEMKQLYGKAIDREDCAVVCETCFLKIRREQLN